VAAAGVVPLAAAGSEERRVRLGRMADGGEVERQEAGARLGGDDGARG
jgi:hypothetical protein